MIRFESEHQAAQWNELCVLLAAPSSLCHQRLNGVCRIRRPPSGTLANSGSFLGCPDVYELLQRVKVPALWEVWKFLLAQHNMDMREVFKPALAHFPPSSRLAHYFFRAWVMSDECGVDGAPDPKGSAETWCRFPLKMTDEAVYGRKWKYPYSWNITWDWDRISALFLRRFHAWTTTDGVSSPKVADRVWEYRRTLGI